MRGPVPRSGDGVVWVAEGGEGAVGGGGGEAEARRGVEGGEGAEVADGLGEEGGGEQGQHGRDQDVGGVLAEEGVGGDVAVEGEGRGDALVVPVGEPEEGDLRPAESARQVQSACHVQSACSNWPAGCVN